MFNIIKDAIRMSQIQCSTCLEPFLLDLDSQFLEKTSITSRLLTIDHMYIIAYPKRHAASSCVPLQQVKWCASKLEASSRSLGITQQLSEKKLSLNYVCCNQNKSLLVYVIHKEKQCPMDSMRGFIAETRNLVRPRRMVAFGVAFNR